MLSLITSTLHHQCKWSIPEDITTIKSEQKFKMGIFFLSQDNLGRFKYKVGKNSGVNVL